MSRCYPHTLRAIIAAAAVTGTISTSFAIDRSWTGYLFAEVRSHQFFEVWPSLKGDGTAIHIKVKVSNGVQMAPLHAALNIDFIDSTGRRIARHTTYYSMGPAGFHGGVDRTLEFDIGRPELWSMASKIVVSAGDTPPHRGLDPELNVTIPLG